MMRHDHIQALRQVAPVVGFLLLAMVFGATSAQSAHDRIALVVGNSKYVATSPLLNPGNDARAVAKSLRALGFDVLESTDLDHNRMSEILDKFVALASGSRIALLFYAGHGMQVSGKNYLIPVDATIRTPDALEQELIEVDSFISRFADSARANIVILDACRDNPFAQRLMEARSLSRSVNVDRGLAAYSPAVPSGGTSGTGILIAFATAPGTVAMDGEGANSPFTTALTRHLPSPGLELRQMLTRVRIDVAQATRNAQIPWDNSSLLGDVYLSRPPTLSAEDGPSAKQNPKKDCFTFNGQEFCQ